MLPVARDNPNRVAATLLVPSVWSRTDGTHSDKMTYWVAVRSTVTASGAEAIGVMSYHWSPVLTLLADGAADHPISITRQRTKLKAYLCICFQ